MVVQLWVSLMNRLLAREQWARERLSPFCGRTLRVETSTGQGTTVLIDERGCFAKLDRADIDAEGGAAGEQRSAAGPDNRDADAKVEFGALLRTMLSPAGTETLPVEGDAALADAIRYVAANLRWDAEEDLARVFGDIAANRIARAARAAREMQRDSADRLAANISEYLTEEKRLVTSRSTVASFSEEAKNIEAAVDALATRVAALESRRRF